MKNDTLLDRFLRYVRIDTQSREDSETFPSTAKQLDLARLLVSELKELGLSNARLDEHGYVMASLPSNLPRGDKAFGRVPSLGFIAHMDTSPDVSGAGVKPQVIERYAGGDIVLPGDPSVVIRESECPDLKGYAGETIITTDGTTLLGADDKAGAAVILTALQTLAESPDILRGDIRVAFTPDEEVGNGTKFFDLKAFGADAAYTLDGDGFGELNKETFSADGAVITVHGCETHPGTAKDKMVNSTRVLGEIIARLPKHMSPETTELRQGFIHPTAISGSVGRSEAKFLLRDFRTEALAEQAALLRGIIAEVQTLYPKAKIELKVTQSYRNMHDTLVRHPFVLESLEEAVRRSGVEPKWLPIRGGTDGSRLTAMGVPTPNLFMGAYNFHSKTEWVSLRAMEKSVETLVNLARIFVEKSRS
jgi:tripeptide aminopeptidase